MSDNSRRKLLKSIAAGSGAIVAGKTLPDSWSRPVVDSVILPVHAQTSGTIFSATGIPPASAPVALLDQETQMARLVDSLVPKAMAGNGGNGGNQNGFYACAMVSGSSVSVTMAGLGSKGAGPSETILIRRGTLDIGGAEGTITASGGDITPCVTFDSGSLTRPAWIDSVSNTEIVLHVLTRRGESDGNTSDVPVLQLTIPRNDAGCVGEPAVFDGCG